MTEFRKSFRQNLGTKAGDGANLGDLGMEWVDALPIAMDRTFRERTEDKSTPEANAYHGCPASPAAVMRLEWLP